MFGVSVPQDNPINRIFETIEKLHPVHIRHLLGEAYETTYRICDHDQPQHADPISSMRLHRMEDPITGGLLAERISRFMKSKAGKYSNMSLTEFLEQPRHICELILETASKMDAEESNAQVAALQELQNRSASGQPYMNQGKGKYY